jgi:simple sugar transport system permease protein
MGFIVTLFIMGIRFTSVLTFAALGETLSQRSGMLNLGMEGYMLIGTIISFIGSHYTGNPWLGVLLGMAAAGMLSLIHGYLCITLGLSQIVSGIGIIFFATGLLDIISDRFFRGFEMLPKIEYFHSVNIPILSRIKIVGPILFQHSLLIYISFLVVPVLWFIVYRTKLGLRIRAIGEFAVASDTMGVKVHRIRYICTLLSGVMGGLAGGFLSLGISRSFLEGMVAGRGFVVLAAIVLGNWNPMYVFGACLLFGMVDAFQYKMQILRWGEIPYSFWVMLPYLVTIGALIIVRKTRQPPELAIPHLREKKA